MKIAFLAFHNPVTPMNGSSVRVNNLIKMLAEHHDVTVMVRSNIDRTYYHDGIRVMEIKSIRDLTYPFSPFLLRKCYKFLRKNGCDLIIAEEAINILHVFSLSRLLRCRSMYDAHNVDCLNYFHITPSRPHIWIFYYFAELLAAISFDRIAFVSEGDWKSFTELFPIRKGSSSIIPNGVDCERFIPKKNSATNSCLFFGSFRYYPNIEALDNIVLLAEKLPTVDFVIAGEESDKFMDRTRNLSNIRILGKVEDITRIIQDSTCVIVPLNKGSGTRLKILEAMACGKPVITTPKGAEGLDMDHNVDLILCELDLFEKSIVELLSDKKKAESISVAARKKVAEEYDWKVIGKNLLSVVTSLAITDKI